MEISQNMISSPSNQHNNNLKFQNKPEPQPDKTLTIKIMDLLQQAHLVNQLKKGANEVLKFINRDQTEMVLLAADVDPIEILMNIPGLCEEKNIPYCFIKNSCNLGRAIGIKRPAIACSIIKKEDSQLENQILEMKDSIEQLFIYQ